MFTRLKVDQFCVDWRDYYNTLFKGNKTDPKYSIKWLTNGYFKEWQITISEYPFERVISYALLYIYNNFVLPRSLIRFSNWAEVLTYLIASFALIRHSHLVLLTLLLIAAIKRSGESQRPKGETCPTATVGEFQFDVHLMGSYKFPPDQIWRGGETRLC